MKFSATSAADAQVLFFDGTLIIKGSNKNAKSISIPVLKKKNC